MSVRDDILKKRAEYENKQTDAKSPYLSGLGKGVASRQIEQMENESLLPILFRYSPYNDDKSSTVETILHYYLVDYSAWATRVSYATKRDSRLLPGTLDVSEAFKIRHLSDEDAVTLIKQTVSEAINGDPDLTWEGLKKVLEEKLLKSDKYVETKPTETTTSTSAPTPTSTPS